VHRIWTVPIRAIFHFEGGCLCIFLAWHVLLTCHDSAQNFAPVSVDRIKIVDIEPSLAKQKSHPSKHGVTAVHHLSRVVQVLFFGI
jgi:hypothetical protein